MAAIFLQVPMSFDDSEAVQRLVTDTGDPDAVVCAMRLWQRRARTGAVVKGTSREAAAVMIEGIVGGTRRRRGIVPHLLAAGLLVELVDGYEILPWGDFAVDWTRSGDQVVDEDEEPSDTEERHARELRLARDRQQRRRDAKRDASRSEGVTKRDDHRDDSVTRHGAERDATVTKRDDSPQNGRSSPRARTRETETETETETKTDISSAAAEKREKPLKTPDEPDKSRYLAAYRAAFASPAADFTGRGVFTWRTLRRKHGIDSLLRAIDGCAADPWIRANRGLDWVCSQAGVERGLRPTLPVNGFGSGQAINELYGDQRS